MLRPRRFVAAAAILLAGAGLTLLARQAYLGAKAKLAAVLIERAWEASLRDGGPHRPWSWADMVPVARLEVPRLHLRRVVLSGASGSSLAFGLGHVSGTTEPGGVGNCAVAGHRDTWAAFLRELRAGDEVRVEARTGTRTYRVRSIAIVAKEEVGILEADVGPRLTLVTCWPFSGVRRSPWRYIVACEAREKPKLPGAAGSPADLTARRGASRGRRGAPRRRRCRRPPPTRAR